MPNAFSRPTELSPRDCCDGYRNLALAVIEQAARDLRTKKCQTALAWFESRDFFYYADSLGIDPGWLTGKVIRQQLFTKKGKGRHRNKMAKLFKLVRCEDVSGVSGTGVVAEGVTFEHGHTVICWTRPPHSVAVFESPEAVIDVHGHGGCTKIEWEETQENG